MNYYIKPSVSITRPRAFFTMPKPKHQNTKHTEDKVLLVEIDEVRDELEEYRLAYVRARNGGDEYRAAQLNEAWMFVDRRHTVLYDRLKNRILRRMFNGKIPTKRDVMLRDYGRRRYPEATLIVSNRIDTTIIYRTTRSYCKFPFHLPYDMGKVRYEDLPD